MRCHRLLPAAALALLAAAPARSLEFAFTYPADIDPMALAGFQAAAARWQANFSDPITVRVNIDFSNTLPDGVLGSAASSRLKYQYNYGTLSILPRLSADITSPDDQAAVAGLQTGRYLQFMVNRTTANGGAAYLDNNASLNNSYLTITTANAKALRLTSALATEANTLQFSSKVAWDFDPRDGISPGTYDFVGLVTHELAHTLGFLSGVDLIEQNTRNTLDSLQYINTLDLFRYSEQSRAVGAGVFDMSADTRPKYFSIDGGNTSLASVATGAEFGDGQQASHWKQVVEDTPTVELLVPAVRTGQTLLITDLDRRALDVIGYDRNFTWKWAGGSAGAWQQPLNWNAVGVPSAGISVSFDSGGATTVAVSLAESASAGGLLVAGDSVTIALGRRSLTLGGSVQVGTVAGRGGAIALSGPGEIAVADSIYIGGTSRGAAGTGSLTLGCGVDLRVPMTLRIYGAGGNHFSLNGGTLRAAYVFNEGEFVADSGAIHISNSFANKGLASLAGEQHWDPGSALYNAGGSLVLKTDLGSPGLAGPMVIVSSGAVLIQSSQHLAGLDISGGNVTVGGATTLATRSLSISGDGRLDLGLANLILLHEESDVSWDLAAMIAANRLYSSFTGLPHPTALGVVDNARWRLTDWLGEPLSDDGRQLIVKLTYLGDVNMDGAVTDTDLQQVIAHLNQPGSWMDGDINRDGIVSIADYDLVRAHLGAGDNGAGGPSLFQTSALASDFGPANMVMVPEPVGLSMVAAAGLFLTHRRTRRRTSSHALLP